MARWVRRSARRVCGSSLAAWWRRCATGASTAATSRRHPMPASSTTSWPRCCYRRKWRLTRPSGSTWAVIASSPRQTARTGTGTRPPAACATPARVIKIRSARPVSSMPWTTRWTRSSPWPRPRACSSSGARARARTCPASAGQWNFCLAAALRPAQLHARL